MREKIKKLTPHFLIRLYQAARYCGITALFFLVRLLPLKKNLVVLCNVWGYGDNAKYTAEELIKRKRQHSTKKAENMELVFITNHPKQVPLCPEIRALKTNSPSAVTALGRAKIWVDNNRKESYIKKRKGQYYIQLWHGGIALKRIEGDCENELGADYIRRAKKDSKITDLFVSNSSFCTEMYRRAFWAKCEIAEYGSPRNDQFVKMVNERKAAAEEIQFVGSDTFVKNNAPADNASSNAFAGNNTSIKNNASIEGNALGNVFAKSNAFAGNNTSNQSISRKHIAVYAPTYRKGKASYCSFDAEKLRQALSERFKGEWEILVRLHPLVAASRQFAEMPGVVDVSGAPDLYEILFSVDVLITDYSNTMFEFAITKKPVFLYASDIKEYQAERGLYFDYEKLPFPKAETPEELYKIIKQYEKEQYQAEQEAFFKSAGLKETGHAAELVADRIFFKLL